MGRKQTIDRGALLDAAERVVLSEGAGQLTMDAVAKEAGVSKGGVLYAFPSKDALIDALISRVFESMDQIAQDFIAQMGDSSQNWVEAHVLSSRNAETLITERSVALITNFMRSPEYRKGAREYYAAILGRLDLTTPAGRKARLAILACEGAMLLRGFDFHPISAEDWKAIHDDIREFLLA